MKPKIFFLLLLSLYIVNCTLYITNATTRYVSKTGSSTPPYTSWETAADSIQKAINICVDGDTVYVANSIYYENLVINTELWLIGSSMDSTVIDGGGLGAVTIHLLSDGYFENFTIYGKGENYSSSIIWGDNKYVDVINCKLSEAGGGILALNNSSRIENVIMTKLKQAYSASCLWGNCTNYISNSMIILNRENSLAVFLDYRGEYSITNNIIMFTGNSTIEPGVFIHADKINISNNLISGFIPNIFVHLIIDTGFVNNNILTNSRNSQWPPATGGILSDINRIVIKNNILTNMTLAADVDQYVNWNYNLFWNNDYNLRDTQYGDSDIVANPMFVKDTIPNSNLDFDFHLQTFSPGIDKGDPNILDKDGTRSDIGMYGGPLGETYTYQDLSPKAPRNFSAVVDTNEIQLQWNRNTEADTSHYNVYRDTVPDFIIDSTKLIDSVTNAFYTEPIPGNASKYVYKITCVDNQGNESKPSEEVVVDLTSVSIDDLPMTINDYLLYQNYPNPFNPSTIIGYKLKERAYVKVMVYDIKGELIKVIVNQSLEAGYYETEFNAENLSSGIYLYRIEVIGEGRIPVYSDMKKMILLK